MKRIYRYLSILLVKVLVFTACSPVDFTHPSETGLPLASDISVEVTVDQETNQVTFSMNEMKGCIPFWTFDKSEKKDKGYSTQFKFTKVYSKAGVYSVEARLMNANGISDGVVTKEFTINNTLVNFDEYIAKISGKEWRVASAEAGHLGCGESGSEGLGWWMAQPDEKAAKGIYDDRLIFGTDMSYSYNPGEGGTVYVNKGCTLFPEYAPDLTEDYMASVAVQNTTYAFDVDGEDVYITFPSKTLFPYVANDEIYTSPRYKIVGITPSRLELISDNGSIAWHYILTSAEVEKPAGYDPDHACNLWKSATITNDFWFADANWTPIENPGFEANGNSYKITMPVATVQTWQAQVKFFTDIATNAVTNYDFSVVFNANKAHKNVTVKLVKHGGGDNDNIYYFVENVSLKAYEDYVFIKTDMPGIDMDKVDLVLDFGGNAEGTEVIVSRVVLKEHACDDGTVVEEPEEDGVNWNQASACNRWNVASITNTFFYADANWTPYSEAPGFEVKDHIYKVTLPLATVQMWQAQVAFHTNLDANTVTDYDFRCVLNSSKSLKGVTVKLVHRNGDDGTDNAGNFFFDKKVDLTAYEDFVFKMPAIKATKDMDRVSLVFDFGGNPENTEVTISGIIFKESVCNE